MAKPIITIIGLGLTGASMGLALQQEETGFELVGHDKDSDATRAASKSGAVHRTEWNLHRACDGADMIVLAIPFDELDDLLGHIGEDLKPDALVLAIGNLMQPIIEIAANRLPGHSHFVAGYPIISGVGSVLTPRVDLFHEAVFSLAPGRNAAPSAVKLASDFVERVGATPYYIDAHEHDGLIAGVEQLPQILAAVLMNTCSSSPGWREAKRLAGRRFAQATELGHNPQQIFSSLRGNRQNLLLRIEQVQQELAEWQRLLKAEQEEDEAPPLLTAIKTAVAAREQWEAQAILKNWEETDEPGQADAGESAGLLRQMFLGNLGSRRRGPTGRQ